MNLMTANKLTIKPVEEEYCYRYLGLDGNKTVFRTNNKNRLFKEYSHMKNIRLSEQSGQNQIKASNSSANTVVTSYYSNSRSILLECAKT